MHKTDAFPQLKLEPAANSMRFCEYRIPRNLMMCIHFPYYGHFYQFVLYTPCSNTPNYFCFVFLLGVFVPVVVCFISCSARFRCHLQHFGAGSSLCHFQRYLQHLGVRTSLFPQYLQHFGAPTVLGLGYIWAWFRLGFKFNQG